MHSPHLYGRSPVWSYSTYVNSHMSTQVKLISKRLATTFKRAYFEMLLLLRLRLFWLGGLGLDDSSGACHHQGIGDRPLQLCSLHTFETFVINEHIGHVLDLSCLLIEHRMAGSLHLREEVGLR